MLSALNSGHREDQGRAPAQGTISIGLLKEALAQTPLPRETVAEILLDHGLFLRDLDDPGRRVPAGDYAGIWTRSATLADDEFFGMSARRVKRGSFDFIVKASAECRTLRRACIAILGFYNLVIDGLDARLVVDEDLAAITVAPHPTIRRDFFFFAFWLLVHGLMCFLIGQRIQVQAIDVALPPPDYANDYRTLFGDEIRFDASQNRLLFRRELLDRPVRVTRESIVRFLAKAPANILVRYRDEEGIVARTSAMLRRCPPGETPSLEEIATECGVSSSTFRRQLEAAGMSYQDIKDTIRRDRAVAFLADPTQTLAAVAQAVGFTEPSSFHHAFKRWTGFGPGEYREQVLSLPPRGAGMRSTMTK